MRGEALSERPLYGDDLAFIHHTAFGDLARGAAPKLLELLARAGIANGLVVDLGRYGSQPLAPQRLAFCARRER